LLEHSNQRDLVLPRFVDLESESICSHFNDIKERKKGLNNIPISQNNSPSLHPKESENNKKNVKKMLQSS